MAASAAHPTARGRLRGLWSPRKTATPLRRPGEFNRHFSRHFSRQSVVSHNQPGDHDGNDQEGNLHAPSRVVEAYAPIQQAKDLEARASRGSSGYRSAPCGCGVMSGSGRFGRAPAEIIWVFAVFLCLDLAALWPNTSSSWVAQR